ncbi:MAG: ribosomal RNA small subunit methyltransferase A [Gemmatimonas sp.]|nr:ribosomal RNA small subunit methyltransferase A [Gemmatimonas sp.]
MPHGPDRPPHRARKSLGQNFLVDPNLQRKIVEAVDPSEDDEILEIGPGLGALTRHLVGRVRSLILVELDHDLARRLETEFGTDPSVRLIRDDILRVDLSDVSAAPDRLKVVGNIPYSITTPIIFHLLGSIPRPALIVLMVQREVADRILAAPATKAFGALTVGVRSVASVERVTHIGRSAFRPTPDVDSTVVRIVPRRPPPLDPPTETALRTLTRAAFGHRRKQFQRTLRDVFGASPDDIERIGSRLDLDLRARPETFHPDDFIRLTRLLLAEGILPP